MTTPKQENRSETIVALDPVCGMSVYPETAAGAFAYKGQTYYFCSAHCLHKFREHPEGFLQKSTGQQTSAPVGIQREKKAAVAPLAQTYTCPMHPEVRQDQPGPCPKCGMAERARIVSDLRYGARTRYCPPATAEN